MCLPCTDDPAGCSPEAGTLGDGAQRGPCSPLPFPPPPATIIALERNGQAQGVWELNTRTERWWDAALCSPGSCPSISQFRR